MRPRYVLRFVAEFFQSSNAWALENKGDQADEAASGGDGTRS